jgi:hypothetical protein
MVKGTTNCSEKPSNPSMFGRISEKQINSVEAKWVDEQLKELV